MTKTNYADMDLTKAPVAECLSCGDTIQSQHRHDFKWCKCKNIAVDGGSDYFKFSYHPGAKYRIIYEKHYEDQDGKRGILDIHNKHYDDPENI